MATISHPKIAPPHRFSMAKSARSTKLAPLGKRWPQIVDELLREPRIGPKDGQLLFRALGTTRARGKNDMEQQSTLLFYDADACAVELTPSMLDKIPFELAAHSTYTHSLRSPRYRIIVPLAEPYTPDQLPKLVQALHGLLVAAGFDHELARENNDWTRGFYLPAVPTKEHLSRYFFYVPEPSRPTVSPLTLLASLAAPPALSERAKAAASLIDAAVPDLPAWHFKFNCKASIAALLREAGYTQTAEDRWLHPDSKSGSPGTVVLPATPDRPFPVVYEHGATGKLADGRAHDAFDVLTVLHCGGDRVRARAYVDQFLASVSSSSSSQGPNQPASTSPTPQAIQPSLLHYKRSGKRMVLARSAHNLKQILENDPRFTQHYPILQMQVNGTLRANPNAPWSMPEELALALQNAFCEMDMKDSDEGLLTGEPPTLSMALQVVDAYIKQAPVYDPIDELLDSIPAWDGKRRIPTLFIKWLGAEDSQASRTAAVRWFTGLARRLTQPGCEMPYALLLVGPQGIGKTALIREIVGPDYYTDTSPFGGLGHTNSRTQEFIQSTVGKAVVEIAEQLARSGASMQLWKAQISASKDIGRMPYARFPIEVKRRFAFYATSNDYDIINDPTGARRVVPVVCSGISDPAKAIKFAQDFGPQILAEALHYAEQGEVHLLLPSDEALFEQTRAMLASADVRMRRELAAAIREVLRDPDPPLIHPSNRLTCVPEVLDRLELAGYSSLIEGLKQSSAKDIRLVSAAMRDAGLAPRGRYRFGSYGLRYAWSIDF